jgi:hypothetical protein
VILSHRHRFLFIKTTKTAGTSVEISMSRYCGPRDVITPISPEDEALRASLGIGPQNHLRGRMDYSLRDLYRWIRYAAKPSPLLFYNHMPASDIRRIVGRRVWDSYFKFAFTRDPFEQFLSQFHWDRRTEDIDVQLSHVDPGRNFSLYTIDGKVAVDFVGRYENLEGDLRTALGKVGIEFDGWLPRAKAGVRKDRRPAGEVLTREQIRRIAERAKGEMDLFGYPVPRGVDEAPGPEGGQPGGGRE